MYKVLIADSMNEIAKNIFNSNNIEVDVITNLSSDEIIKIIHKYEGLVVRSSTQVTKEIILAGKKLKIIGRAGAGVDNIDLVEAKKNDIIVMNTPGANTNATAEHTLSLLLSLYRKINAANISTHKGFWEKKKFKGYELKGKNLGIIGFGNVGKRFAEISISLGMKVCVFSKSYEKRKKDFKNIKSLDLQSLLKESDIVSLHCNKSQNGKPIISINELKIMKKNSVIINTARGGLIDENDLKTALSEGLIMGAALDVFSEEPAKKNTLFGTDNLLLTPHIAASTIEAQIAVAEKIALQISNYFNNGTIINSV